MQYIIGTGWWCSDKNPIWKPVSGDNFIRSVDFHKLWYYAVNKYTNPEKICIVDSASSRKPNLSDDSRLEWISLNHNFNRYKSKYYSLFDHTGWMKSVLLSAMYALLCEVDYYIYIEQDCLVRGKGWIDVCISKLEKNIEKGKPGWILGHGRHTPGNHKIQQSLFLVKMSHLWEFIQKIVPRPSGVHLMAEERFSKTLGDYCFLPFGYGRSRYKFSVDDRYMYAQQWRKEELISWCRVEIEDNLSANQPELNTILERAISILSERKSR